MGSLLSLLFACTSAQAPVLGVVSPPWPPDPAVYDCRAREVPDRVSTVPTSCALDRSCDTPLVSGHRGMGGEMGVVAPENTIWAVYAAIAYGVDFVETDPRPTADGVLVNHHDTTVERVSAGVGTVDQMTLAELKALALRTEAYPGEWGCAQISTLEEILQAARGRVHVLVDANKTDRVDLLVQAIVDTDSLEWAVFDTSSTDKIQAALALEPDLHTMIRVDDRAQLSEQLALFADHPPDIVEIDLMARGLSLDVIAAGHKPLMNVFLQDPAAALNDNFEPYLEVFEAGVVVAQSDRPELVVEILR